MRRTVANVHTAWQLESVSREPIGHWPTMPLAGPPCRCHPRQEIQQVLHGDPPIAALSDAVGWNQSLVGPLTQRVGMKA